ncbi:MAG: Fur family transcriptional regulator [Jatrophihabitantaceae bacterium]
MGSSIRTRHTTQADLVQNVLREATGFASAQDIYARLRADGRSIGLSTVYRHLQALAQQGAADMIATPGGEMTYRYCQAQGTHHHHVVCRRCGRAEEVAGRAVERWASAIAEKYGYTDVDHTVEVFGICSTCTPAPADVKTPARGDLRQ